MIRFLVGFCMISVAVGAAEGSAGLGTAILLATAGTIIMLWGVVGINERNLG